MKNYQFWSILLVGMVIALMVSSTVIGKFIFAGLVGVCAFLLLTSRN